MSFSLLSLANYSTVAVTACCSGAGVCLVTHGKWNKGDDLQAGVRLQLAGELRKRLHHNATSCIPAEREHLSKFKKGLYYRTSAPFEKYDTSRYQSCFRDKVTYDDVVQKLFAEGK